MSTVRQPASYFHIFLRAGKNVFLLSEYNAEKINLVALRLRSMTSMKRRDLRMQYTPFALWIACRRRRRSEGSSGKDRRVHCRLRVDIDSNILLSLHTQTLERGRFIMVCGGKRDEDNATIPHTHIYDRLSGQWEQGMLCCFYVVWCITSVLYVVLLLCSMLY